jgi:hypothetical protein
MKQKTALLAILVAMAVFGLLQARGGLFGVAKKDVRSAAFLSEVAAQLNKQLPKAVDQETELASVTGLEGVFVYNYRLVSRAVGDVDAGFATAIKPLVTKAACTAPDTHEKFLKQGITLRYAYTDMNGTPVTSFDVTLGDCGA